MLLCPQCLGITMASRCRKHSVTESKPHQCKHFVNTPNMNLSKSECCLSVPKKSEIEQVVGLSMEQFIQGGLMVQFQKFIVSDDQVCLQFFCFFSLYSSNHTVNNMVDNPHSHELLLYLNQDHVTDNEILGCMYLIIKYCQSTEKGAGIVSSGDKSVLNMVTILTSCWSYKPL